MNYSTVYSDKIVIKSGMQYQGMIFAKKWEYHYRIRTGDLK